MPFCAGRMRRGAASWFSTKEIRLLERCSCNSWKEGHLSGFSSVLRPLMGQYRSFGAAQMKAANHMKLLNIFREDDGPIPTFGS